MTCQIDTLITWEILGLCYLDTNINGRNRDRFCLVTIFLQHPRREEYPHWVFWPVFRFEAEHNAGQMVLIHSDDTLMAALRAMWKYQISGVPVLDRSSKSLSGNICYCDLRIILDKPHVFHEEVRLLSLIDRILSKIVTETCQLPVRISPSELTEELTTSCHLFVISTTNLLVVAQSSCLHWLVC